MNLSRSRQSVVTRIIRSHAGKQFLAQILVVENESGIEFRILSAQPIVDETQKKSTPLSLPIIHQTNSTVEKVVTKMRPVRSPFASDFTFFNSQPTRAPSLNR